MTTDPSSERGKRSPVGAVCAEHQPAIGGATVNGGASPSLTDPLLTLDLAFIHEDIKRLGCAATSLIVNHRNGADTTSDRQQICQEMSDLAEDCRWLSNDIRVQQLDPAGKVESFIRDEFRSLEQTIRCLLETVATGCE
jgi:hypothetical protein